MNLYFRLFTLVLISSFYFTNAQVTCGNGITVNATITSDYNGSAISCNNSCDGEITVSAVSNSGGPFEYSISGPGLPPTNFSMQTVYPNLCDGAYLVTSRDLSQELIPGSGIYEQCSDNISISEPQPITLTILATIEPSCDGICDAQASVSVSGGTGIITIDWESGDTGTNPIQLCEGLNNVTLTDENNCIVNQTVMISPTIDNTITANDNVLTVNESGATYQWIDCNNGFAAIPGETGQSFTAMTSGSYAVEITDINFCTVISDCENLTILNTRNYESSNFKIHQLPNSKILHFNSDVRENYSVNVFSLTGKRIVSKSINNQSSFKFKINYPSDLYIIEIQSKKGREYHKVILR
ncbi:MAG: T9SS type A sorting domain-containing protein [Winogradskyella sp.]|nr:MAG: T9SS type A sorting domain-containing protein [Winogradskyella sp.]